MSSSNYLAILVCLQLSTVIIGQENSNASCIQFDEAKLADVLHLIREPAINTVEITVNVASANRTRVFPEMKWPWANEIGRTLISLISRAETSIFSSIIFTFPLKVSLERVSIEITEETIGCLPSGKKGSDQVFTELLKKHFLHLEEEDKDNYYKLCRPHDIEGPVQFNCCRIAGDNKLTICADYSSIVLDFAFGVLIAAVVIFCPMTLPLLLQHITKSREMTFYKTSYSHMSLTSIVSRTLFEGDGAVKSFFRRCFFVGLTFAVFFPADFLNNLILLIVFSVWAFLFCIYKPVKDTLIKCACSDLETKKNELDVKKNQVSVFTIPFSLPFYFYKKYKSEDCCKDFLAYVGAILLLIISPLFLVFLLLKFVLIDFFLNSIFPYTCKGDKCALALNIAEAVFINLLTLAVIVIFAGSILIIFLSITVGLILNGEFFNPFFAPVVTLIFYFWKNWQFSVEAQCLQLKTSTIDVCKEKAKMVNTNERILETQFGDSVFWKRLRDNIFSCNKMCCGSDDNNSQGNGGEGEQILAIKFDEINGEAMISKKLYDVVSERILPLGELLFSFFRRIVFVVLYALIMLIVLVLGKESGVSGSLQAISAIVAILIPFLFDTIYADHHLAQKNSKNMAIKEKLEHIIWSVKKLEKNLFVVELKIVSNLDEQIIKLIEQSFRTIKKSFPTSKKLWPKIEQSWSQIEQSRQTIKQLRQALVDSSSWSKIEHLEHTIEELNKRVESLRGVDGELPLEIKRLWRRISQWWTRIGASWKINKQSWQTIEESFKKIELSGTLIERMRPTLEEPWVTVQQTWQNVERLCRYSGKALPYIPKLSWDKIEEEVCTMIASWETFKRSSQEIKNLWQNIEGRFNEVHAEDAM